VLIGGACSPEGDAIGEFVRLSEAAGRAGIIGFTTASGDPRAAADAWLADLARAGAGRVDIPIVGSRRAAQDRDLAARVSEASGIFLGGGDQIKLVATLGGTAVAAAMREAFIRGAVVCGTSAGAAALSETTLAHGEIDEEGNEIEMYIGPGFGLLGYGALIDTHFAQRRRLHRLFVAIADYPQLMGLGIDEDTALVVRGHVGEVVGRGGVTFVDGRTVRYDNADRVSTGAQLTLSHLRVGIVGTGHSFNLRERELEVLVQVEPAPGDTTLVASKDAASHD